MLQILAIVVRWWTFKWNLKCSKTVKVLANRYYQEIRLQCFNNGSILTEWAFRKNNLYFTELIWCYWRGISSSHFSAKWTCFCLIQWPLKNKFWWTYLTVKILRPYFLFHCFHFGIKLLKNNRNLYPKFLYFFSDRYRIILNITKFRH